MKGYGESMKIFVLEDDSAIGMGLSYSLENEGYTVTLAKTVSDALNIIENELFSLYILDLTLPDGSGYDVCKKNQGKRRSARYIPYCL